MGRVLGGVTLAFVAVVMCLGAVKLLYPLRYSDALDHWARESRLDPTFVAAVVRTESRFRPGVVSHSGAIGLMQITPDTGRWIATQLGEADFAIDELYDPEVNLRFGTWYLRYLIDRFPGAVDLALAAYNAGPTTLARWQTEGAAYYPETSAYIDRVKRNRRAYHLLYATPVIGSILRLLPL
jgi:soluble lytic murein transglycosylase